MRTTSPETIVEVLAGQCLTGAVMLPNGMLGLLFDDGHLLAVSEKLYLMHEGPAADVLVAAQDRLRDAKAELATLDSFMGLPAVSEPSVRERATRMRDDAAIHTPRRKIEAVLGEVPEPEFIGDDHPGLEMDDVQKRARLEKASRGVPDVL